MKIWRLLMACLILAAPAAPVAAAWMEARSDHFIIDANTSEPKLRDFAERLERFDSALRRLYGIGDDPALRANRLTIFAVDNATVTGLCRGCPPQIEGFYLSHAGRSVVVTAALGAGGQNELSPQAVLLHEYSHHFMFSSSPGAYPLWYSEGFAEFNATAELRRDGSVVIGLPAQYRAYGLLKDVSSPETGSLISQGGATLTIRQLLDPPRTALRRPADLDRFYGRSWLLMHYLELSPDRRGQLAAYIDRIRHGQGSLDAAQAAFGDIDRLGIDLASYLADNHFNAPLLIPPTSKQAAIDIHPLSSGAGAMMPTHMRSMTGTTVAEAKAALPAIIQRAAPFPQDSRVQSELSEAAYDAHEDVVAEVAADRAIAADPKDMMALLYKGRAMLRAAIVDQGDPARLVAARGWIVKANRVEPDSALPLISYYKSFTAVGQQPSAAAVNGLLRAAVVAPEDTGVRWMLARRVLDQGDADMARDLLEPIAFAPHNMENANLARQTLDKLGAKDLAGAKAALANTALDPSD